MNSVICPLCLDDVPALHAPGVQDAHGVEHKELLAAEHTERRVSSKVRPLGRVEAWHFLPVFSSVATQEALVQEFSARLATALGVTDIISLCVLALVFLLALYFVWGGTVNKLLWTAKESCC